MSSATNGEKKEKSKDKESRDKDKDRKDKDKSSRKRSRHSRSRSKSPRRSGSRDKDKKKRSRKRSVSKSRSRSPRKRSRSKSRSRSPRREKKRSPTPPPRKDPQEEVKRKLQELEREQNKDEYTAFVSQIHPKVDERDLFEFFSLAGRVEDIRLIKDQRTHKSKGLCYVEFWDKESVMKACALTGQLLCGYPITVVQVQLDKNKTAASGDSMRLYVGSLHFNVTEGDLKPVFEAFGAVEFIEIHKDPGTGQSKGFGFVQFKNSADAKAALVSLNGLEIAGRPIKVGLGEQSGGAKTDKTSEADLRELDDDGGAGVAMNAGSRQALMAKLSQRGQGPKSSNVIAQAENLPVPRIQPTTCVVVKNMFDPNLESEANWDSDIREDVTEECEKLGAKVKHIYVDTMSQGNVYLRFFTVPAAESVVKAFHGRFFATKQIQAEHITETTYLLKFPDAR